MTLVLAAGNPDHAVLVADRRVLADGLAVEDGSNDGALIVSRDARLAVTFSGFARSGVFETKNWLLLALHAAMQSDGRLSFERLCQVADLQWTRHRADDARLTVVMAGYLSEGGERFPALGLVSNWELPPDMDDSRPIDGRFRSVWWRHTTPRNFAESYAVPAGAVESVTEDEIAGLRALAASGAAPEAIVTRGLEIVRAAALRPEAEGAIGSDCVSIVLAADPTAEPVTICHTADGATPLGLPNVVTPESILSDRGVVRASEPQLLAPRKLGRNSGCPCGSGKKYKVCHGR